MILYDIIRLFMNLELTHIVLSNLYMLQEIMQVYICITI